MNQIDEPSTNIIADRTDSVYNEQKKNEIKMKQNDQRREKQENKRKDKRTSQNNDRSEQK